MILQSLNELYSRLADDPSYEIAPPGFSPQKVSFRVVIEPNGNLFAIEDARTTQEGGKPHTTPMLVPGGAKPPGSGINPCLLWDNQIYLLGRQPADKEQDFGQKRFDAFRERHLAIEKEINALEFTAVCLFLGQWKPGQIPAFPILDAVGPGFGIFQIRGQKKPVHELPAVQKWWIRSNSEAEPGAAAQCLLTGEIAPIAVLHPKIKGIKGSQSAGASIVSFNATAYESYGKDGQQGLNAPVSETAAFRYGTALNSLLSGPNAKKHRINIGGTATVFWTEEPSVIEDCLADLFSSGSEVPAEVQDESRRSQIQRLLEAIRSGTKFQELGDPSTPFHILGLAPNAARLSIRFYHRSTIADLIAKLHSHQECMEITHFPSEPEFPSIGQILHQIKILHRSEEDGKIKWKEGKEGSDKAISLIGGSLTRAIINGSNYPEALFAGIIRRITTEKRVSYLRAAMLKAILIRNYNQNIPTMLDPDNTDPAYLLGRLFAVLEKTQDDALGNLNTGIRDRFYSAASATPVSVFPRLIRTYQHHLSKLNGGAKVNRDKLVQEILASISSEGFPSQLSLKKQGIFAIGYYHQRKDFFTKREPVETQPQS
jgi:CRISPR-associated protein Csd1